jgi:thymidine kinase
MSQTDSKTLGAKSPKIYQTPARDDKQPTSNNIYSSLD